MAEMRWMCWVKVTDRFSSSELRERERLAIGDIITVIQRHRLRWYVLKRMRMTGSKSAWILKRKV